MGFAAGEASSHHYHRDQHREERTDIDSTAGLHAHTLRAHPSRGIKTQRGYSENTLSISVLAPTV